jgi:hypothetical protein
MPIKVEILGAKEIEAKLNKLPIEVADTAIGDVQDYMVNVLRSDQPSPTYVSRTEAYGQPFSSDRQRRWFFASLNDGSIQVPYHRTQEMSRGWHIVEPKGLAGYIVNYTPGITFVMGERNQARQPMLVGWKKVSQQISDRMEKINKIIDAAAKKAISKLGL